MSWSCPGAVVILFAEVAWLGWRLWRWLLRKGQPPNWVLALEFLLTPAWLGWVVWWLWQLRQRWAENEEERPPSAIPAQPTHADISRRISIAVTSSSAVPISVAETPPSTVPLANSPLGPLPVSVTITSCRPGTKARVLANSGRVNTARVDEWVAELHRLGYEVHDIFVGTTHTGWEIEVPPLSDDWEAYA